MSERIITWEPVLPMLAAWRDLSRAKRVEWERLVKLSSKQLHPLADPFTFDYSTHRWFCGTKENSYSDWLAWILMELDDAGCIGDLFGLPEFPRHSSQPLIITREEWVLGSMGGEGGKKEGRMDIRILVPGQAVLVLEVKLGPAEAATDQLEVYAGHIENQYKELRNDMIFKKILARSNERGGYGGGFVAFTWKDLCLNLRRKVRGELRRNNGKLMLAAAMLHFTGAVEQTLTDAQRPVGDNIPAETLDYLRNAITEEDHREN